MTEEENARLEAYWLPGVAEIFRQLEEKTGKQPELTTVASILQHRAGNYLAVFDLNKTVWFVIFYSKNFATCVRIREAGSFRVDDIQSL